MIDTIIRSIVTLTGPSCAGKTTLEAMLVEQGFAKIVSTTSRPIRPGEIDGKDYHFVTQDEFDTMERGALMIESVAFNGYGYGVSRDEITKAFEEDKPVVVVVEPNGMRQIKAHAKVEGNWNVLSVFINNPIEVLLERFVDRCGHTLQPGSVGRPAALARLKAMMTTERAWVADAHIHPTPYGVICDAFNDRSAMALVSFLREAVTMELKDLD